jgi:adenylate cyclase
MVSMSKFLKGGISGDAPKVAVLPFADTSGAHNEQYLSDGLAEDIVDTLSKVPGLKVTPRTATWHYRDTDIDLGKVARRRGLDAIVTGSAHKTLDGGLDLKVQMHSGSSGKVLWSEHYERPMEDVFAIQNVVARNVAKGLGVKLSETDEQPLRKPLTSSMEAYEYYLRGLEGGRSFSHVAVGLAQDMFAIATENDEEFALAFARIADCSSHLYQNGDSSQAQLDRALESSLRAVELDPDDAQIQISRGMALILNGENDEGMAALERAIELAPNNFGAHYHLARACFAKGETDKAKSLYERAMEIHPDDYQSPMLMALVYEAQDRKAEATATRRKALELANQQMRRHPDDVRALYMGANALVALGETDEGLSWSRRARTIAPEEPLVLYNLACIHALAHDPTVAIGLLERAVDQGYTDSGWMAKDDDLEILHDSPRFAILVERATKST